MTEDKLLTVREAARRCRRSEETIRRWIWSGKLAARKLGNQLFVEAAELARLQSVARVSELRVTYDSSTGRRGRQRDQAPRSGHVNYDREQKLRELEEDIAFGEMLYRKYGPVDVTELLRQVREEDD